MATAEVERLAAACLFPGFEGLAPPDWVRSWLERGLGGVVLFARNVAGPEQLAGLTGALRGERPGLLVAVDEEGGDVTRLEVERGSSYPGNCALGAVDDVDLTRQVGKAIGGDLARVGVDLNLAPVADVNSNQENSVIGVRSFGADASLVARHVAAFVAGLQSAGVAACAKHFPGHGDTALDSHFDLPTVTADRATLEGRELLPFRAAIDAGVRAVMTAHVIVPALDDRPATVSRRVIDGLLRAELGFGGLVITDALEMGAMSRSTAMEENAVAALAAGADALCLGADCEARRVERVHAGIVTAVEAGTLDRERLSEAAERVAEAARRTQPGPGEDAGDLGLEAARRAVRAEGALESSRPFLVVELEPPASMAAGRARHSIGGILQAQVPETEVVRVREAPADPARLLAGHEGRALAIVVRDAHRYAWERETAAALLETAGGGIVVETGVPVWRPSGASAFVATYGAGRVNLEAAAERLLDRRASVDVGQRPVD